ncbi:MAG: glycosyltransferase family 4 protein [Planctomycetes bacterium]|nr:glycosyltransferase family 4 protein [Planctomycetota bacterium]
MILTQYYQPELIASAQMHSDIAVGLARKGARVRVLAAQPAIASPGAPPRQPAHEYLQGVRVRRVANPRWNRISLIGRLVNFAVTSVGALIQLLREPKWDLLVVDPTSPFNPLLAWLMRRLRGLRYAFLITDVYPTIAISLGYVSPTGLVARLWHWAYRLVCRDADCVIVLGECMRRRVRESLLPNGHGRNLRVIHGWADERAITPCAKRDNPFCRDHSLHDKFVVLYSGNLGRGHDLETLLDAADRLRDDPEILFLIIGDGAQRARLQAIAAERELPNVRFLPYQSPEIAGRSLTCGDVCVVSIRKGIEGLLFPWKFYSSLASGRPILAITDARSEVAGIIETNQCGLRAEPGDAAGVVAALRTLKDQSDLRGRMGRNARALLEARFTRERAIEAYDELFAGARWR